MIKLIQLYKEIKVNSPGKNADDLDELYYEINQWIEDHNDTMVGPQVDYELGDLIKSYFPNLDGREIFSDIYDTFQRLDQNNINKLYKELKDLLNRINSNFAY